MSDGVQRHVVKIAVGDVIIPTPGDVVKVTCRTRKDPIYKYGESFRWVVVGIGPEGIPGCSIFTNSKSAHIYHEFKLNPNTGLWHMIGCSIQPLPFELTIIEHLSRFEVPRAEPEDPDIDDGED